MSGLSAGWGDVLTTVLPQAISYRMNELTQARAAANARLLEAQRAQAEAAASQRQIASSPTTAITAGGLPIVPIALGAAALLGIMWFLKRK